MLKKLLSASLIVSLVISSSICAFAKDGNHNEWDKHGNFVKHKIEKFVKPTDIPSYGEIAKQLEKDKGFYQNEDGEWFVVTNIDGKWYGFSEKGGAPVLVGEGVLNVVDYDTYKSMKDGTPSTDEPSDIPATMHFTGMYTADEYPIYENDGGLLFKYYGDGVFENYGLIGEPPLPSDEEGDIGEPPLPPEPPVTTEDEPEVVVVTSDDVNTARWTIKGKTTEKTKHGRTIVTEGAHVEYNGKDVYQKPVEKGDTVNIVAKTTEVTKHGRTIVTEGAHYEVVQERPL